MVSGWTDALSRIHRVAFDSNALIYFIERQPPYDGHVAEAIRRIQSGQAIGVVSVIIEMELLVKPLEHRNEDALDEIDLFSGLPQTFSCAR